MRRYGQLIALVVAGLSLVILLSTWLVKLLGSDTVQTVVGLTSAIIGGISALAAFLAVSEMRRDRTERNQPLVLVDLLFTNEAATWLTIKNIGNGIAFDVSFEFNPIPVDYAGRKLTDLTLFQAPLPVMSPNQELRQIFFAIDYFDKDEEVAPRQFTCTVRYRGEGEMNYERPYQFDLERFRDLHVPRPTEAESLAKIARTINDMNTRSKRQQ